MKGKQTSIRIEPSIWKIARMKALENDLTVSQYLEGLIKKDNDIKER